MVSSVVLRGVWRVSFACRKELCNNVPGGFGYLPALLCGYLPPLPPTGVPRMHDSGQVVPDPSTLPILESLLRTSAYPCDYETGAID